MKDDFPKTGDEQWACYSLGMYKTVASSVWNGSHLKGGFALAISLAASGRFKEAEEVVSKLTRCRGFDDLRFKFAASLSPYLPSLALGLVDTPSAPLALKVSLLLKNGKNDEAKNLLSFALKEGNALLPASKAQLYLLASNVLSADAPTQQLSFLNRFFASYGLAQVALKDATKQISVTNLTSAALPQPSSALVSVLMTAHNTSAYISSAIESLREQSYQNIEIVVID
ncbi:MAG: glycosyltransferase, partial [Campylobacteraceae bacterium]|nr:glycosyltransferase [Campylobacteraceae bacterium]